MQPLEVERQAHQAPFSGGHTQATQRELAKAGEPLPDIKNTTPTWYAQNPIFPNY
jgi:hypothetical protein